MERIDEFADFWPGGALIKVGRFDAGLIWLR